MTVGIQCIGTILGRWKDGYGESGIICTVPVSYYLSLSPHFFLRRRDNGIVVVLRTLLAWVSS